jgi:hypothetical protein
MGRQVKDQLTGQTYNFPDDATDEQISESMASMHPVQAAAAPAQSESDFNKKLIDQPMQDVKNTFGQIKNFADDVSQGVIQAPIKAAQFVARGVGQGLNKFGAPTGALDAISNFPTDDKLAFLGSRNQDGGSQFARSIGETLPYAALGGTSILGQIVSNAAQGAADSKNGKDELLNTLVSGAAAAVPGGAFKLFEKLRPSNVLRGTLTPDELARNLEQTKGTSTGLGPIIGSKKLKDELEIKAPQYFGTGANETMQNTAQQIQAQGKGLLDTMRGNTQPSQVPSALKDALSQAEADVNAVSKQKAGLLNTAADNAGIKVKDEALQQQANAILSDIGTNAKLARKVPDSIKEDLQYYANNPQENQSLKEADIFNPTLRDEGSKLYQGGDKYLGNIYKDLYDAARADVDKALDSATDKNVIKLRDDYRAHFGMEKKPFEDPDVAKFTKKGGDPDLFLKTFLKTGNTDRPIQLEKAMSKLPEDKKNLMAYAHYSPAINEHGVLDPRMIASLHGKLGTEQKAVLFKHAPELLKQMDNYAGLVGKNQKAFNTMFSPENGAKLAAFAPTASMAAGAGIGAKIAGVPGAIAGGALGLVGPSVKGRITTKLLTSEKLRTKLVNKMIENKKLFDRPSNVIPAQTLSQSLINSKRGNQ